MSLPYHRSTEYANREEWLAGRRLGIGGSDAPAVLRKSPWVSPWALWADKRGLLTSRDSSDRRLLIGNLLEPVVAQLFEIETGIQVSQPGQFRIFFGENDYQRATLDRIAENEVAVELKTENFPHKWKDGIPLYYQIQIQHQMAVIGADRIYMAVFFGPNFEFQVFEQERNDRFIGAMTRAEEVFWRSVLSDDPPEVDGSESTRDALQLVESDKGTEIELPADELRRLDQQREESASKIDEWTRVYQEAENKIKALMGPNEIALLNGQKAFTWKANKNGTRRFLRVLKGE